MLLFDSGKKLEQAFTREQFDALVDVLEKRDSSLAASQELTAVKTELKADIAGIDARLRETELRLQKEIVQVRSEMQKVKYDMLKWQLGVGLAIIAVMAKGFGWIGF